MLLSQAQINEFFSVGYIVLPKVFSPQAVAEIGAALDRITAMAAAIKTTTIYKGAQFVVEGDRIDRVVWCGAAEPILLEYGKAPELLTPVSQLLGSRTMEQLICQFHPKLPGDTVAFEWHQDSQHRGWGTDNWKDLNGKGSYVQTLTAIDAVTPKNGPVLFVPGSGSKGHLYLDKVKAETVVDLSKAVPVLMDPGDVALFGPYVVHGSQPNESDGPRRVFINGYAYPGCNKRVYPGEGSGRTLSL